MSKAGSLTKNPTLLTAVLSLAAVAGYLTYRFTLGSAEPTTGSDADEQTAGLSAEPAASDAALVDGQLDHEHVTLADSLPEIVLDDLSGTPTPLANFAGQPLLINFWATWCAPCLREIPMLKAFHVEDPSIRVVGIAVDRFNDVVEYAAEMQFNYPVIVGQTDGLNAMATFHNDAGAMPFSVFTSADGAVLGTHAGELHEEHLQALSATVAALNAGTIDLATARERLTEFE
jgi:thiol-disulfide isomerase/thioredoxin